MSSLFERIKSAIPSGGLEIASYKVIRQTQHYEERLYPPQTWVRTQMRDTSRENCTYPMFWKLFNYISGQNDRQVTIPMTAPVSVLVELDGQETGEAGNAVETTFTMAFYIPAPFDENPPLPIDPSVSIEYRPELRILARTFGGFTNDRIDQEERSQFLSSLTADDKELVNEQQKPDGAYYCAGYDPPLKLFFRRNEIWFPIAKSDPVIPS